MPEPIVSHIQFSEEIKPVNDVGATTYLFPRKDGSLVEKATDAQAEIDLLLTAVTSNCSSVATY